MLERAAEHVATRVPRARRGDTVGDVIAGLVGQAFDAVEAVYILDAQERLCGAVELADLLCARSEQPIVELAKADYPRVGPHHDQEHVAAEALARKATSVAVVDDDGHLIGAVTARSLLEILQREHVEDLHRLAGITREDRQHHEALEGPPTRRARHRLPWLLVGLAGSMLAAIVMSRFEHVLDHQVAVAFFVPAIVYLADAIGTQTEAIAVRGLSLSRVPIRRLLVGEIRTGLLIGATLAALSFPVVALMYDARLAISFAAAVLVAGGVATTTGLLLPWVMIRFGSDPAFGSGPLATIIQDILSISIYFAIVTHTMT